MSGRSLHEIAAVAGKPSITEFMPDGSQCTWDSPKYAIKLKFDSNNICLAKIGEVAKK